MNTMKLSLDELALAYQQVDELRRQEKREKHLEALNRRTKEEIVEQLHGALLEEDKVCRRIIRQESRAYRQMQNPTWSVRQVKKRARSNDREMRNYRKNWKWPRWIEIQLECAQWHCELDDLLDRVIEAKTWKRRKELKHAMEKWLK